MGSRLHSASARHSFRLTAISRFDQDFRRRAVEAWVPGFILREIDMNGQRKANGRRSAWRIGLAAVPLMLALASACVIVCPDVEWGGVSARIAAVR